jgi:2-haloalkanoic acid dehalogenase type II
LPSTGTKNEVLTFDCYGTLIDWETGIQAAFRQSLRGSGLSDLQGSRVFGLYEGEEKRIESEKPFRSYREVLSLTADAVARKLGMNLQDLSRVLVEQLPTWHPFPDTNPALEKLANKYRLGILSNIDDDLLKGTMKHFTIPFDFVVTAEQVRSYKPGTKHFEEARRIIGADTGWLHVAASLYHDIQPASKLGVKTVWVNRQNSTAGKLFAGKIVKEVQNLTGLTEWLKLG